MWIGVVLVVLPACLAACSSGHKQKASPPLGPAVPWVSSRPALFEPRAPVARVCHAADLRVPGQVKFVPRLQGGIALVQLRNRSKHACRLMGRPRVRLVKQGGPVQVDRPVPPTTAEFPDAPYPPSVLGDLRPGEAAAVTITWDNWCDRKIPGKKRLPPSAVRITLPAGRGHVDADYNAVVPCLDPASPSSIGVSVFQPSLVPQQRPWSNAPLIASVPGQPVHGRRGSVLHYRVVLKNYSSSTVRFDRCPPYIQQLAPAGKVDVHTLNCRGAHPVGPRKTIAFAMQIRIPKSSPLGANGLFWELDPYGARSPQAHVRVVVGR
jgi:hypothetical protein